MDKLKEFLDWHCENPHNVNFKMLVEKEYREETLKMMQEISELLDTDLTPEQIRELKERDTAKAAIITGYNRAIGCKVGKCPKCGGMTRDISEFCDECGQRLKWED